MSKPAIHYRQRQKLRDDAVCAAPAPSGGRVDDVRVSGGDQGVFAQIQNGLAVVGRTVQLKPGQQIVLTYDILTGTGQPDTPVLRVTPVTLGKIAVNASSGCS